MSEFKREPRYVVLKIKDALAYLSACQLDRLQEIGEAIAAGRTADGKPPFNAVVVEQDWPEFVPTWDAIEARMLHAQEPPVLGSTAPCPECGRIRLIGGTHCGNDGHPCHGLKTPNAGAQATARGE